MIGKGIVKERPVTLAEVLDILTKQKKLGELGYAQRLTFDHTEKFARLDVEKSKKLVMELLELGKIREHQAIALVNLMPETKEDIKLIFAKERTSLEEADIERLLEIINKYL